MKLHEPEKEPVSRRWYVRTAGGVALAGLTGCLHRVADPETALEVPNESLSPSGSPPASHNESAVRIFPDKFVLFDNEDVGYTIQHPENWETDGEGTSVVTVTADTENVAVVITVTTSDTHLDFQWDAAGRQAVVETARAHLWAHDWRTNTTDANFELSSGRLALFFDVESPEHVRDLSLWVLHDRQLYQLVARAPAQLFTDRVERLVVRMFNSLRIADEIVEDNCRVQGQLPML